MSEVFVIYGNQVESMVRQLLEKTGAMDRLRPDDRVMIKPNLLVSRQKWVGINTDPRVVEALVKTLKERGIHRITVGDGSGMGYSATKAFEYCGYRDMASRYGLNLVDLERDEFIEKPVHMEGPFKSLEIARTALECDYFVNVPLMKAHNETLITCSLKNLKGTLSRSMKTAFHGVNLHKAIAQLNSVLLPNLIIVDGLQGDLHSESGHDPVVMDRMILGTNPVEVDSFVADALGYQPRDIRHIAYSADAGLGTGDLEKIKIQSLNRPSEIKRFSPPTHYSKKFPCSISAEGACCTCMGNFIFALERLNEKGILSEGLSFLIGQHLKIPTQKKAFTIAVGQCASKQVVADLCIDECPPTAGNIYQGVASAITKR
ncbi:MAG: hypothetical protein H6Q41_4566 [Deltaproteobacteria bacterium]|nr:hypothetical protein [Deltaproteobacteria bacterium]